MKRRIALSIALVLSVALLSLMTSDSTAQGQTRRRFVFDSGVISPNPNQVLRITVTSFFGQEDFSLQTSFRRMEYTQDACNGAVCRYSVSSTSTFPPVTLAPGEAVSLDIAAAAGDSITKGVRGVVLSSSRNVQVTAQIIDTMTGEVRDTFLCRNTDQEQFN